MSNPTALPQSVPAFPPKVPSYPLVGSLPGLVKGQFDFLEENRKRYGDIYTLDLGFTQATILCHPRHAQHILVDNARNYSKGGPLWDSIRTLLGSGLPVSEGELWKRQRRMVQPAFHHKRLVALTEDMVSSIDEGLAAQWEAPARTGESFNVAQASTHMTMRVLLRTMFGSGLEPHEMERVSKAFDYVIAYVLKALALNLLPAWMPSPGRTRYQAELKALDEVLFKVIARGRKTDSTGSNLLALLLDTTDGESDERMNDQQLRDEAMSLFLGGYETTAVGIGWAFHLLARYPELARRLQAEVDEVLGQRTPGFADLQKLPYARGVMQEALRVCPPSYWTPRTAVEDDEIDGFRIPAGSVIGLITFLIHRHPEIWPEPEKIDPERFFPQRSEGRHKQAWIPFGAGQRQCIGKEFSLMEGTLILIRTLQRYNMVSTSGHEPKLVPATTMRFKDGVWVNLSKR